MAHYRFYCMDSAGLFKDGAEADCQDDEAARRVATGMLAEGEHAEIWHDGRLVGQVGAIQAGEEP